MEFSLAGREKRFAVFDARGLAAIKADLADTDRSSIGGRAAISLAWEWVVMKENAAKEIEDVCDDVSHDAGAGSDDSRPWIASVNWKAAWRGLWRS